MTSKSQRKARKRAITLAGGQSVPQRPTGRDRTHTNQPQEDARMIALNARVRAMGGVTAEDVASLKANALRDFTRLAAIADTTGTIDELKRALKSKVAALEAQHKADMAKAIDPALATDLGKCIIHLTHGDERAQLLDAWGAISASHRNYRLLYIGQTGDPQGAAIGFIPDRMETDQSLRVDMRTHDEKVASAKAAWGVWQAKIEALPWPQFKWCIRGALDGFMGEASLWRDREPSAQGRIAVDAIRGLSTTS